MRKHGGLVEKRRRRKVTSRSTEKTHALKKTRPLNLIQNFKIIRFVIHWLLSWISSQFGSKYVVLAKLNIHVTELSCMTQHDDDAHVVFVYHLMPSTTSVSAPLNTWCYLPCQIKAEMGQGAIVRAFLVFFHEMARVDFLNGLFRDGFFGPKIHCTCYANISTFNRKLF